MLKLGALGTLVAGAAVGTAPTAVAGKSIEKEIKKNKVKAHDDFPYQIDPDYKPFDQRKQIFTQGFMRTNPHLAKVAKEYMDSIHLLGDPKLGEGYTQVDHALREGAGALMKYTTDFSAAAIPGHGILNWAQKKKPNGMFDPIVVAHKKHKFSSKSEATEAIKRAAKLYGADLVGITKNDPRWNYTPVVDFTKGWEGKDPTINWSEFPFKPKSVIVLAFEMDYEAMATAPSLVEEGATMEGYSRMSKTAFQMSVFLKNLGYQSVPCTNDTALSVPYAIAAGLGEASRIGILVTYKYGPRVRLAKVFTDFDFVEYDKPQTFGVFEFCKRCKRCADACPSNSIPFDDEPTWKPTHKNAHFETSNPGVYKWYLDGVSCWEYWAKNHGDCGSCIAACPYNKPDFWHHRLVDRISALLPGTTHSFMKEMDKVFGYGNVADKKAVRQFWSKKGKSYDGF
jgi:reductive dehalogenase